MPDKAVPEKRDKKPTRAQPKNKEQGEMIINIPLAQLHPFPDHPFKVRDDDTMQETTVTHTYQVNDITCSMHTCWTQKGRLFLYELLCEHGILPIIELP